MPEQKGTLSSHDFGEKERERGERDSCWFAYFVEVFVSELHLAQIIYVQVNMFMYCARTAPWIRN